MRKGKGWHKESRRHSMARKGIKTVQKLKKGSNVKSKFTTAKGIVMSTNPFIVKYNYKGKVKALPSNPKFWQKTKLKDSDKDGMPNVVDCRPFDPKKQDVKNIPDFVDNKILTEQQVNLLKRRLNDKKITTSELFAKDREWKLTPEQAEKGLKYLMNQWKSPLGRERENNPFGYREQNVLENFSHFELIDFYDNVNYQQAQLGIKNYQPLYRVVGKDGSHFDYWFGYKSKNQRSPINIVG